MVDEPMARVSPRRLLLALCVTVVAVPVIAFGGFGLGSASTTVSPSAETPVVAGPPPAKGISLAPTGPVNPVADTETSSAPDENTPTTRSVSPASTVPEAEQVSESDEPPPPPPPPSQGGRFEEGQASWSELIEGSCIHRTIAFETVIRVTNITTGASTTCVVLARGPYVSGRIVELDRTVFAELASTSAEVITVRLEW